MSRLFINIWEKKLTWLVLTREIFISIIKLPVKRVMEVIKMKTFYAGIYAGISSLAAAAAMGCATPETRDMDAFLNGRRDYSANKSETSSASYGRQPGETKLIVIGSGSYSGLAGKGPIDLSDVMATRPLQINDSDKSLLPKAKKERLSIVIYEPDQNSDYPEDAEITSPDGTVKTDKGIELIIEP